MSEHPFAPWADDVYRLNRQGNFAKALSICKENYPFPGAFRNAAVAIRKQIRERRRNQQQYNDLLAELYRTAVCENFYRFIKWSDTLGDRLCKRTAGSFTERVAYSYKQIGYENLELLNATDKKWLVEQWGEPETHSDAKEFNKSLWKEAVEQFAFAAEKGERAFYRSHGFPKSEIDDLVRPKKKQTKGVGCLLILLLVVIVAIIIGISK